jgi:guanylate kinase
MAERLSKAAYESGSAQQFDSIVINDDVDLAAAELLQLVEGFLENATAS